MSRDLFTDVTDHLLRQRGKGQQMFETMSHVQSTVDKQHYTVRIEIQRSPNHRNRN